MNYYSRYYRSILRGERAKPRGLDVTYITNATFTFFPGQMVRRKGDNPAIGFVELLQFLSGTFDLDAIRMAAPNAKLHLFTGQSAYGPRTEGQFEKVINELHDDPDSRRAIVQIAHHEDMPEDLPCTLTMQFQLKPPPLVDDVNRTKLLYTTVTMRSSDVIWGLPYDMIQFGGVALAVASCLRVRAGMVQINIGNAHVYDATKPERAVFDDAWEFDVPELSSFKDYSTWAQRVLDAKMDRAGLVEVFKMHKTVRSFLRVP